MIKAYNQDGEFIALSTTTQPEKQEAFRAEIMRETQPHNTVLFVETFKQVSANGIIKDVCLMHTEKVTL